MPGRILILGLLLLLLGCASWSTSRVHSNASSETRIVAGRMEQKPETVLITETGLANRTFRVLGDIEVTVHKTTIFNKDPTHDMVNEALKQKAAELGADAVIFVRYGSVGISGESWGSLGGKGRAISFSD